MDMELIITSVGLLCTIAGLYFQYLKIQSERKKFDGITQPREVVGRRNSIMLLGRGGSGKTTFIRGLMKNFKLNPEVKTENYELYDFKYETGIFGENRTPVTFFIGDYRGQNVGTLVKEFIEQQKQPFHPMAWGHITSLILIVDLVPPNNSDSDQLKTRPNPDRDRIREHLSEWNETALDAVFGFLTKDSLQYVCLFINKVDLISNQKEENLEKIEKEFDELKNRLKEKANYLNAEFEIILGSAIKTHGLGSIAENLAKFSVVGEEYEKKIDTTDDK